MKKGLLIWVTMLILAFTMSFSTVLSFADPTDPSGDPVVTEPDPSGGEGGEGGETGGGEGGEGVVGGEGEGGEGGETGGGEGGNGQDPVETPTPATDWKMTCASTANFNDGKAVKPNVTVTLKDGTAVSKEHYTVTYSNNTAATKSAKATVSAVEGSTVITGTKSKTFAIVYPMSKYAKIKLSKTSLPVKFKKNSSWKPVTVAQKPTVKVTGYGNATLKNSTDYTYKYSNSSSKNAGTYYVTVTAKKGSKYSGTLKATYKITPIKISYRDFYAYGTECFYTGKKLKPKKVTVDYYDPRINFDMELTKGTHYTVTKGATYSNNRKVGFANIKITVKGKGNFTGTKTLSGSFFIGPEKAKIKSLKAGKKQLTVKWSKAKHADGYVVYIYGWNDNGKDAGDKTIYVNSRNTLSKTIKNLKSGYHYDVWVHSYKKIDGQKFYVWNNSMKSVKVK